MLKKSKPTSAGRRSRVDVVTPGLSKGRPTKQLVAKGVYKRQGKNNTGKITVRHRGGGVKRKLRLIEWSRKRLHIPATVVAIEYDPMRSAHIALLHYVDGSKSYILAPSELKVGDTVMAGADADIRVGNSLPLSKIPVGMPIHNIEMRIGKGAQLVRTAGTSALIQSKEGNQVIVQLPSREFRLISADCFATIGQVGNVDFKNRNVGKAGRRRLLGWRPRVRGTAQHPGSHPHGGGEGRSSVGLKFSKTPWGKHAMGTKTRSKKKYSNKYIVQDRRIKK